MRLLCHAVPFVCVLALMSGCYLDHSGGGDPPPDPSPPSGREPEPAPPPRADASRPMPPPDAEPEPPPPRPLSCPSARGAATCLDPFMVTPFTPFSLPVSFPGCGCCTETDCVASVDTGARTIHLSMGVCPDPCDCDGCSPITGSCEVPALPPGLWTVTANGDDAFSLLIENDSGLLPAPNACATYAEGGTCTMGAALPPRAIPEDAISRVCAGPMTPYTAISEITFTHACWPCTSVPSVCVAELEERLTDDLPPGGEIRVSLGDYESGCFVSCDDFCAPRDLHCQVPDLERGQYYRVWMGDEMVHDFVADFGEPACVTR